MFRTEAYLSTEYSSRLFLSSADELKLVRKLYDDSVTKGLESSLHRIYRTTRLWLWMIFGCKWDGESSSNVQTGFHHREQRLSWLWPSWQWGVGLTSASSARTYSSSASVDLEVLKVITIMLMMVVKLKINYPVMQFLSVSSPLCRPGFGIVWSCSSASLLSTGLSTLDLV